MKSQIRILIFFLIPLLGCAQVKHFPELVTLKRFSDEQALSDQYVDGLEEKFKVMKEEIDGGQFDRYKDKAQVLKKFGEPAYVKTELLDNPAAEMWMYRRPVNFNSDKAYLYFDDKGQLLSYKLERYNP